MPSSSPGPRANMFPPATVRAGLEAATRACSKCGETKPTDEFHRRKGRPRGASACKSCCREKYKDYYEKNRAKVLAKNARWRAANDGYYREYMPKWYAENRDELRAKRRAYYRAHKAEYMARLGIRRRGLEDPSDDTLAYWEIIQADPCAYCGAAMEHIDHIQPVDRGGANDWENTTATCASCNQSKFVSSPLEFMLRRLEVA